MSEPLAGPPSLLALARAETIKLSTRTSARLGLVAMVLLALGVPVFMQLLESAVVVTPPPDGVDPTTAADAAAGALAFDVGSVLSGVLGFRNFFVFRAAIIAVVAVGFAGEIGARTLREDLVRPVHRWTVLLAKWLALQAFVLAGAVVPFVVAAAVGWLLFGGGELGEVTTRYALTWLGDVGFASLVVALSLLSRSVPGTIGGVFLYWVVDRALGWALWGVDKGRALIEQFLDAAKLSDLTWMLDLVQQVRPWLPSSAFDLSWDYDPEAELVWQSFVALGGYTALSVGLAVWLFSRMDVD